MSAFALLRAGYGAVMVVFPSQIVVAYAGRPARPIDVRIARVLGARHLLQAAACAGAPTRPVLLLGVETDVLHAASALLLAAADRPRRRAGLVDAAVAGLFAASGAVIAGRAPVQPSAAPDGTMPARLGLLRDRVGATLAARFLPLRALRLRRCGSVSRTGSPSSR